MQSTPSPSAEESVLDVLGDEWGSSVGMSRLSDMLGGTKFSALLESWGGEGMTIGWRQVHLLWTQVPAGRAKEQGETGWTRGEGVALRSEKSGRRG